MREKPCSATHLRPHARSRANEVIDQALVVVHAVDGLLAPHTASRFLQISGEGAQTPHPYEEGVRLKTRGVGAQRSN
jgi:hypothetical protein